MVQQTDLATFMDRVTIRERIDLYIDHLNHRDWAAFEDILTHDMVWSASAPVNQRIEGRDAMIKMLSTVQEYQHGWVFQMGHGVVVHDLTERSAKARHTLHIMSDKFTMLGIYYDRLVKEDDGIWRFARRDYRITHYDNAELPGNAFRQMPDPTYRTLPE